MPRVDYASSNLPFALSCAFDALLVIALVLFLVRGGHKRLRGAVILLVLAVLVGKGALMIDSGLTRPFGLAHVLWLDLVIVAPLAGLTILATRRRHRSALATGSGSSAC